MRQKLAESVVMFAFLAVVAGAAGFLLLGARGEAPADAPPLAPAAPPLATATPPLEGIVLAGSGANVPLMSILASEYRARTGKIVTVAGSIGSSGGILALEDGVISAAMLSREPRPAERERWRILPVARTRVALAAHSSVAVPSLTQAQVAAVFQGRSDLGLAPFVREQGDSGTAIFCQANPEAAQGLLNPGRRLPVAFTDQEMERLLESRPGSLGLLDEALVGLNRHRVRLVPVRDSSAPALRTLYLVSPQAPSPELARFLDFVSGPEGAAMIRASGYEVP